MELEMSIGKSLGLWGRGRIASVVLTVLYGGIYELYQTDPRDPEGKSTGGRRG
ncbi:MAG: hypothetical protein ACLRT5_02210 [Lachnospiraceae bacterium]